MKIKGNFPLRNLITNRRLWEASEDGWRTAEKAAYFRSGIGLLQISTFFDTGDGALPDERIITQQCQHSLL
jgi:hypothetical protein